MDYSRIITAMWQEKQLKSEGAGENGCKQFRSDIVNRNLIPEIMPNLRFDQDKSIVPKLLNFFGLTQQPFGVTPDPSFLYLSQTHREALASLVYGIETGRGFMALIAKPGMGKTTLLFHLLHKFRDSARSAFVFQTQCNSREFLQLLFSDLGFENSSSQDFVRTLEEFNQHLLQEARAGKRFIVLVDEAQNLDASVLETVRLLSNFETPKAKLLQIVLTGQPELGNKLARRDMAQLKQRLSSLNRLEPFSATETQEYIQHRLRVSGYQGDSLLTSDALNIVTEFSKGIPRNINNFCFNALSLAFAMQQKHIDGVVAREVTSDLDISLHPSESNDAIEVNLHEARRSSELDAASENNLMVMGALSVPVPHLTPETAGNVGGALDESLRRPEPNHAPAKEEISALNVVLRPSNPRHSKAGKSTGVSQQPLPSSEPNDVAAKKEVISTLNSALCPSKPNHAEEEKSTSAMQPLQDPSVLAPLSVRKSDNQSIPLAEAKEYMDKFIRGLRSARS